MRKLVVPAFSLLAVVAAVSTASAEVRLTIERGHVTLVAKDATIQQILAEWERVGRTKVVNAERIGSGRVSLELTDVPEKQALDVVLRSVSGMVLAPRATADGNLSAFERIVVVPTTAAPSQAVNLPPPPSGPSPFPQQAPPFPSDEQDGAALNRGGAVFSFPPPQVTNPQQGPVPPGAATGQLTQPPLFPPQAAPAPAASVGSFPGASSSSSPAGVAVPGMVVPAPTPVGPPGFPQPPLQK